MNNISPAAHKNTGAKIIVIKCGGSIINNKAEMNEFIHDLEELKKLNYKIILIHGGGPDINRLSAALNIKSTFIDGLRVTSAEVLDIAKMVLLGKINVDLVHSLNQAGLPAVGLSGHTMHLLVGKCIDMEKLGFVGTVTGVNSNFLELLLQQNLMPVIAPLAIDNEGNTLNINADLAASAIAIHIKAEKLLLLTDVDGYYTDYTDKNSLVPLMTNIELKQLLLQKNSVSAGMIPKLNACLEAVDSGVNTAHIINGNIRHGILEAILNPSAIGTMVIKGEQVC